MKTGKTLVELAQEIERQENEKVDYLARTDSLLLKDDGTLIMHGSEKYETFGVTDHAHNQISARLDIPKKYYNRMRVEQPALLSANVNTWFEKKPETRMVRTLDGNVRAFLSDRYRSLDNYDMMTAILPILQEKNLQIASCDITDHKLYIKALVPGLRHEITKSTRKGDIVNGGIVISNSEVGMGGLSVQSMLYFLACTNGMVMPTGIKKYHVGKKSSVDDQVYELLRDETKEADDKAFWMKLQDVTRASLDREIFQKNIAIVEDAVDDKMEASPVKVVEKTVKKFSLTDKIGESVLNNLIEGADLSRYGLMNAVTAVANNHPDYETATELERTGGKIVILPRSEWMEIAA